ncbi:MAG: EmrB/QacA family drug resistance transporter, partial [Sphingomonadales bacterium]|nr:EmrB/QacA family drug resistance transporter [Sphingomonadales bacterium]
VTAELIRNGQTAHADIGQHVSTATFPQLVTAMTEQFGLPAQAAFAMIDAEINRQAAFIAYLDDFRLMMWVTFAAIPLVLLLRPPKPGKSGETPHAAMD